MKSLLKSIYLWLIKLIETIVSSVCVSLFSYCGVYKSLKRLRKAVNVTSATILANGPSAKEILSDRMDLIQDTDVLVVNFFGNTEHFFKIKPKYYMILDPAFFDRNWINKEVEEADKRGGWALQEQLQEVFKKVDWKMYLFAPITKSSRKAAPLYITNPNIEIVWMNCTRVTGFKWFENFMYRRNLGVPSSINVLIPAIQMMINAGYENIYLYGAEFSWTKYLDVDVDNGKIFQNDVHFYGKNNISYLTKGTYRADLLSVADALSATEKLEDYSKTRNSKVINRTKGSFIDAFEYENPDKLK